MSVKGIKHTPFDNNETSKKTYAALSSTAATETEKACKSTTVTADDKDKTRNFIISALGDLELRVVRTIVGEPFKMMQNIDARYDSK